MMEQTNKRDALLKVYQSLNGPNKAGPIWVTYNRKQVDAMLFVMKQLLELEGFEFRKDWE